MAMKVYVGTSGWFYNWNPDRNLDWFVKNSRLNTVELNASFYRFPFPNQIKSWAQKGKTLRWAIKASRLITHIHRFNPAAFAVWQRFAELFTPLDKLIDFYLFQLHPKTLPAAMPDLAEFAASTGLGKRFALECRHPDWFSATTVDWAKKLGITLVSIDAPGFSQEVFNTTGLVYLRMHGRTRWYQYHYSLAELKEQAAKIRAAKPKKAYVFFNNDQNMLKNARQLISILTA